MDRFVHDTAEAVIYPGWGIPPEFYWDVLEQCGFSSVEIFDYGFFQDDGEPMIQPSEDDPLPPVLIGHSMGAVFAVRAALREPESVRRLILLNPFPCFVKKDTFTDGWDKTVVEKMRKNLRRNPGAQLNAFLRMCASPSLFSRKLPETLNARALDDGLVFLEDADIRAELPLLEEICVTVLESGSDAIVNSRMSGEFCTACGAVRKTVPGGNHLSILENPSLWAAQLRDMNVL